MTPLCTAFSHTSQHMIRKLMRLTILLLCLVIQSSAYAQSPWNSAPAYRQPYPPGYAPGPSASGSPVSIATEMLAAHNAVRAHVGEGPLVWSTRLAAAAQDWAEYLIASHAFFHSPDNRFGENLYRIPGGVASPAQVVAMWAGEASSYDTRSNGCTGVCGHYTQIIWSTTRAVGCASASDVEAEVWVCEYDPPGNIVGARPF